MGESIMKMHAIFGALAGIAVGFGVVATREAQGATFANGGFETDTFTTWPGYISGAGNGPITGWTATDDMITGINPGGGGSPFADNGAIPEGSQVAFIQNSGSTGTLSQTIFGLTSGQEYRLSYRYNARASGTVRPQVDVKVDGATLQETIIMPVGGTNQYYQGARTFVATGATATVTLANTRNTGDSTMLIDDVKVESASAPGWTVGNWTNDDDSGIDSALTYTHALNFGTASDVTVKDVLFTGTETGTGGNPSGANFSWTGLPNTYGNDANSVTGSSAGLANDFNYSNDNTTEVLTITGLTAGQQYVATFYGVGFDNQPGNRFSHWTVDGETVTFNENENGNNEGIRLMYRYTAPGNGAMTFSISELAGATYHQYAFSNHAIPEPSTLALAAMGLMGLARRRRRT